MVSRNIVALAVVALSSAPVLASSSTATYRATFDSTWSAPSHPGAWPGPSAHYSPLIGSVHSDRVVFWEPGGLASPGIERMAETGATSILTSEVNAQISQGTAQSVVNGPGFGTPASASATFTATTVDGMTQLTLVTMIAPSPDWFVGVHGLELFENGGWVNSLVLDQPAYDAGTDNGINFTSGNSNTNPQEPITSFDGVAPFAGLPDLGTLTITLLSVTECLADADGNGDLNIDDIDAFVDAFLSADLSADLDGSGTLNLDDLDAFVSSFLTGCE